MREIEQDGFITDEIYIQETKPLERVDMDRAIPAKGCKYPKCEECRDYRNGYCTVPIVVTKQMWLMSDDRERELRREISDLKEMVADTVLGEKSSAETGNYSFSQANSGSVCENCAYYEPFDEAEVGSPSGYCVLCLKTVLNKATCIHGVFKP